MEAFPKYYTVLFNSVTDAIQIIRKDPREAEEILRQAQIASEELYVSEEK